MDKLPQRKVIIMYGGSYNPPLCSHFAIAQQALDEFEQVEKVVFVPVNKKYPKDGLLDNEHRYNMLSLVAKKNLKFDVSRIEIDSDRSLYTFETLRLLREQYNNYDIWFMVGTDNLKMFDTWKNQEELLSYYKMLVVERDDDLLAEIISGDKILLQYKDSLVTVKNSINTNMSSTFVRQQLESGKSIKYLTTDEICEYIKRNNLYSKYYDKNRHTDK